MKTISSASSFSRRRFLKTVGGLALPASGLSFLEGCASAVNAPNSQSETLETTTIRLSQTSSLCVAPQIVAEQFLKAEGFTDVQYVPLDTSIYPQDAVSNGEVDMLLSFAATLMLSIDAGHPIVLLAGIHVGCFKLFATGDVHTIRDLKGKTIAITGTSGSDRMFATSMATYVGLDPNKDITWLTSSQAKQVFIDGGADAFVAFPPVAQELQDKKIGQVIVDSMNDKPWSQYFCCLALSSKDFVSKNPVAAKRAVRALLQAADFCALHPEQSAQIIVDKGVTKNYDYAVRALKEIHYNHWREFDPEDTVRFYSLRLREAGMITNSPDAIIRQGTDWRFLSEIKNEIMPVNFSSLCTDTRGNI